MSSLKTGGHHITVIAWDRLEEFPESVRKSEIEHRFILRGGGYRNRKLAIWYPIWMIRLLFYLVFQRPHLIWASNFETALPAAVASMATGIPFIYYIHDNLCLTYQLPVVTNTLFRWLDKWTLGRAKAVIVPDESRIEKHAKVYKTKFSILPNSPSLSLFPCTLLQKAVSSTGFVFRTK